MNKDSLEELGGLVMRMRKVVDGDPSMVWIGRAVSRLEEEVRDHMETRIWRMHMADVQRVKGAEG